MNPDFWDEVKQLFTSPALPIICATNSTGSSNVSTSSVSSTALNSVSTSISTVSNHVTTAPVISNSLPIDDIPPLIQNCEQENGNT